MTSRMFPRPGHELDQALEAEAEAGVGRGAVAPQLQVPPVLVLGQAALVDPLPELVEAVLPLRAADDLTDLGHQHVHGRHRPLVVVEVHVEGLDLLGIVDHHHRPPHVFFHEVPLMLALEVDAPGHRILEGAPGTFEYRHRLGIGHALEGLVHDVGEGLQHRLVDALVEEGHVVRTAFQHALGEVLEKRLGQVHVPPDVAERHFRLHHPELRQVPAGVGVLRAERRPEGVDVAQSQSGDLRFELPGHREPGLLAEEVPGVVNGAGFGARRPVGVQGWRPGTFRRRPRSRRG